jgi:hypothetical protein
MTAVYVTSSLHGTSISWAIDGCSAGSRKALPLWNWKLRYRVYKIPTPNRSLNHFNPVQPTNSHCTCNCRGLISAYWHESFSDRTLKPLVTFTRCFYYRPHNCWSRISWAGTQLGSTVIRRLWCPPPMSWLPEQSPRRNSNSSFCPLSSSRNGNLEVPVPHSS